MWINKIFLSKIVDFLGREINRLDQSINRKISRQINRNKNSRKWQPYNYYYLFCCSAEGRELLPRAH